MPVLKMKGATLRLKSVSTEVVPVIGHPRSQENLHVSRRTAQPHHADANSALHPADERIQQEIREPPAALSLYFAYYNFVRIHSTIRVTPAMEAGLTDHVWTIEETLDKISLK